MELVKNKRGIIIPEQRIIVYRRLLKEVINYRHKGYPCFMCNILAICYEYIDLNTLKFNQSPLPELRRQRPRIGFIKQAWYMSDDYQSRITAIENAIKLWEAKYSK